MIQKKEVLKNAIGKWESEQMRKKSITRVTHQIVIKHTGDGSWL